jgi:hypothetical protein
VLGHAESEQRAENANPLFDLQEQRDQFALAMRVRLGKDGFPSPGKSSIRGRRPVRSTAMTRQDSRRVHAAGAKILPVCAGLRHVAPFEQH